MKSKLKPKNKKRSDGEITDSQGRPTGELIWRAEVEREMNGDGWYKRMYAFPPLFNWNPDEEEKA